MSPFWPCPKVKTNIRRNMKSTILVHGFLFCRSLDSIFLANVREQKRRFSNSICMETEYSCWPALRTKLIFGGREYCFIFFVFHMFLSKEDLMQIWLKALRTSLPYIQLYAHICGC